MKTNVGIIIQARLNSQRLPGKVLKPLLGDKAILDIVVARLKKLEFKAPIILATGNHAKNAPLESFASRNEIAFYRGSENDVLKRFIDCASAFQLTKVVRICADNPFLDINLLGDLLTQFFTSGYDYVSYAVNGKPTIITHYGFFAEFVTVDALLKTAAETNDAQDREHVTKFIYNNPDKFSIRLQEVPKEISNRTNIRLTVDTGEDFQTAASILQQLAAKDPCLNFTYREIFDLIDSQGSEFYQEMQTQIQRNSK